MDLIGSFFSALGVSYVIALAIAVLGTLLSLFFLRQARHRWQSKLSTQMNSPEESEETAQEMSGNMPMSEQDILDRALERAYQNPDAPSGFGASSPPPRRAAPMTRPDAVAASPIEEEETEIAIPQIVVPSPAATEPESSTDTSNLTELQILLLKKLESDHNSPLSTPVPSLSLPESTDASGKNDIAASIAKPSENVNAADESRPEKPPAIILPRLVTEQMFAGLAQQACEPNSIEKTEQTVDTIEQKIDAIFKITTGKKKPTAITDQVSCSVFAPSQTPPGQSSMVQVFLHVDADLIKIREMALEADQGAERRLGTARLKTKIVRDAMIDIVLEGRGLEVDDKMQSLIWRGKAESVNFIVTMPEGNTRKDYFPIARLFIDGIPIGHIKFKLSVVREQEITPIGLVSQDGSNHSTPQGIEERIYKRAFLSYSRKNFDKVSHFNEGLVHAGYQTFFDLESLSSGERWNDRIMQEIRECDVFYLFWTSQSKSSKWVDQETRYAHDLFVKSGEKSPDIVPILFETPMPSPPDFISDLHFNSRHQLIRAGMSVSQR